MLTRYYEDEFVTLYHGNNLDILPALNVGDLPWIDAVITDPPYGLSFMGKKWDYDVPGVETWRAVVDLMKPGAHLLSFFSPRTYHRGATQIEDASLDIRDQISWIFGQGFPKSLDVSKAMDKAAGAEREAVGERKKLQSYGCGVNDVYGDGPEKNGIQMLTAPTTDEAKKWQGWGTSLKPAFEPLVLARKPFAGTVAQNVMEYGTGALNIDGSRVGEPFEGTRPKYIMTSKGAPGGAFGNHDAPKPVRIEGDATGNPLGRWPANIIHDGSEEVLDEFAKFGERAPSTARTLRSTKSIGYGGSNVESCTKSYNDKGTAARFFYTAKASKKERGEGNNHPTVKPLALMRYLIGLVTPPGGIILDPFAGSGTTLLAAQQMGVRAVGIEQSEEYCRIIVNRLRQGVLDAA